jgi:hypothetical protein
MVAGAAGAQNMPLPTFVQKGTSLEKKGPLALLSRGEIRLLQTEMGAANKALVAEYEANKKAGRKQAYCPVKGQKVQIGARQLLAELRAIPAAQARTMTTTDGLRLILARRMPCPAA